MTMATRRKSPRRAEDVPPPPAGTENLDALRQQESSLQGSVAESRRMVDLYAAQLERCQARIRTLTEKQES
jgi:hypothetical protein